MTQIQDENWFRHALDQSPWRSQQRAGSLALAVVVIVGVIGALYLAQSSATAAAGRRLQAMEAQRQALEQQNAQLRAELAALRSVPRLIAEAERMGFRPADSRDVEYLTLEGILPPAPAASPSLPSMPEDQLVPTYDETLESWLSEQLADFRVGFQDFIDNTFGQEEVTP